jgi:hypothetical protein
LSVGGVLAGAWALYRRGFRRYVAIAAAAFVVLHLVSLALDAGAADAEGATRALLLALGAVVVLGSFVAYAALVHGGRGEAATGQAVAAAYTATARRLGTVLAAAVVQALGIAVGILLFVLPGLYLATRWSLVFQAIVLEARGWREAFGRSAELVRGHFRTMLGLVLVTFAASAAALLLPLAAEAWLPLPDAVSGWVVGVAADSLAFPYFALLFNVAYERLATPAPATRTAPAPAPVEA